MNGNDDWVDGHSTFNWGIFTSELKLVGHLVTEKIFEPSWKLICQQRTAFIPSKGDAFCLQELLACGMVVGGVQRELVTEGLEVQRPCGWGQHAVCH